MRPRQRSLPSHARMHAHAHTALGNRNTLIFHVFTNGLPTDRPTDRRIDGHTLEIRGRI